ncbi:MAG: hypothetical protein WAT92_05495 [Saprospiraceae bacterium]
MDSVTIEELKGLVKELIISQKETDSKFKETDLKFQQTDKHIKEAFDLFEGQWGKLMESLIEGDLIKLLKDKNIAVHRVSSRIHGIYDNQEYEYDLIAHNGNEIVIVEVKTTLRVKYVNKFVEDLKKAKERMKEYENFNIYGGVAFLRSEEESAKYAESMGLFVIRATGNSAHIINAPSFEPHVF